jgi:hypothetical protein
MAENVTRCAPEDHKRVYGQRDEEGHRRVRVYWLCSVCEVQGSVVNPNPEPERNEAAYAELLKAKHERETAR